MYIIHLHSSAPVDCPLSLPSPISIYPSSTRLCFSLPRVLFPSCISRPYPPLFPRALSTASSRLFSPSRLPVLRSLFYLPLDSALPHSRRLSHEPPHSREHFHPATAVLGGGGRGGKASRRAKDGGEYGGGQRARVREPAALP